MSKLLYYCQSLPEIKLDAAVRQGRIERAGNRIFTHPTRWRQHTHFIFTL